MLAALPLIALLAQAPADAVVVHDWYAGCMMETYDRTDVWLPEGDRYRCGARTIPRSAVEELRRLALASREDPPDLLAQLGVTPEAFQRHEGEIRTFFQEMQGLLDSKRQPAPLPSYLADLIQFDLISDCVLETIHGRGGASTTRAEIEIQLPGSPEIRMRSWSEVGWKLPWEIETPDRTWKSGRMEVSRAVIPLMDPESPNLGYLDGAWYWTDGGFWDASSNFFFWADLYDRDATAREARDFEQIPGYDSVVPFLRVDASRPYATGIRVDMRALATGPIQKARWFDQVRDSKLMSSWSDFLVAWDEATDVTRWQTWIEHWRVEEPGREVCLISQVTPSFRNCDDRLGLERAWEDAGFHGKPSVELLLRRGSSEAAVVHLGKEESGALITSAIPGPGEHWLDHLDVAFHWRTPTYVRVDSTGQPQVRSMPRLPDPTAENFLECHK